MVLSLPLGTAPISKAMQRVSMQNHSTRDTISHLRSSANFPWTSDYVWQIISHFHQSRRYLLQIILCTAVCSAIGPLSGFAQIHPKRKYFFDTYQTRIQSIYSALIVSNSTDMLHRTRIGNATGNGALLVILLYTSISSVRPPRRIPLYR
jgi:hypothetical protein